MMIKRTLRSHHLRFLVLPLPCAFAKNLIIFPVFLFLKLTHFPLREVRLTVRLFLVLFALTGFL